MSHGSNFPKRGDIWLINLDPVIGHEIGKSRPSLIISNDRNNEYAQTLTVLPITSKTEKIYPFEVSLFKQESGLSHDSKIKTNQIRTVDKKRAYKYLGCISEEKLKETEYALLIHLGMSF